MIDLIATGLAVSPSGRRVRFGCYKTPNGHVKAYRTSASGQFFNWEITVGWNFDSIEHAIEIITDKGWSVEMDE